jgi:hypothetical protein
MQPCADCPIFCFGNFVKIVYTYSIEKRLMDPK